MIPFYHLQLQTDLSVPRSVQVEKVEWIHD